MLDIFSLIPEPFSRKLGGHLCSCTGLPGPMNFSPPAVDPGIEQTEQYRQGNDHPSFHFHIYDLFQIVDKVGTCICPARIMHRSQPYFKMRQGTVPVKDLKHEGEDQPADMDNFERFVSSSPKSAEDEKEDPEKMDENNDVRNYPDWHCLPVLPVINSIERGFTLNKSPLALFAKESRSFAGFGKGR